MDFDALFEHWDLFYFKRSNDVATTYMWGGLLGFLSEAAGRVVCI